MVHSLERAIELTQDDPQPFVIGGGEIYKIAMEAADKIELTRVHGKFEADAFFRKSISPNGRWSRKSFIRKIKSMNLLLPT